MKSRPWSGDRRAVYETLERKRVSADNQATIFKAGTYVVPDVMKARPSLKKRLASLPLRSAAFIEPIECLAVPKLFDCSQWTYEIKLDGYRAVADKSDRGVRLFSRHNKSFNNQYPDIVEALGRLSENTVVDGEIVALDESGRPNFNLLQNYQDFARFAPSSIVPRKFCSRPNLVTKLNPHGKLYNRAIAVTDRWPGFDKPTRKPTYRDPAKCRISQLFGNCTSGQ